MISIDPRSSIPIYEQIIQNTKEAILKNLISPGEKLPSIREMASILLTNPNTVSKAYSELERQNIIETLRGKGTYICENVIEKLREEKMQALVENLKDIIQEAKSLEFSEDKLCNLIKDMYKSLGGEESYDRN